MHEASVIAVVISCVHHCVLLESAATSTKRYTAVTASDVHNGTRAGIVQWQMSGSNSAPGRCAVWNCGVRSRALHFSAAVVRFTSQLPATAGSLAWRSGASCVSSPGVPMSEPSSVRIQPMQKPPACPKCHTGANVVIEVAEPPRQMWTCAACGVRWEVRLTPRTER